MIAAKWVPSYEKPAPKTNFEEKVETKSENQSLFARRHNEGEHTE